MPALIIMNIWRLAGFTMIVYLSGLQTIPHYLYEASRIDGASKIRQFFSITIPMLAPTTFFLVVMTTIFSFQVFDQVYVMTSGGPMNSTTTIVHQIYKNAFEGYKMGYASSMSVVLLVLIVAITLINFKYGNRGGDTEIG
ncbi:MAG: carbohydrate ABC transporter permease [Halanaerobiales bacterium]